MRAVLLVVATALVAQAAPHPGKVVRIERKARRFAGDPRWCGVSIETMQAFCYGKQPAVGAAVTVMDMTHTLGVYTADKVDPLGVCKNAQASLWQVHLHSDSTAVPTPDSNVAGLIDVTVDTRVAKMVKVDEAMGNRPAQPDLMTGFDLDGDEKADLAMTSFSCDENGDPIALYTQTQSPDTCVEMWYASGHGFEKLRTDRIGHNCF